MRTAFAVALGALLLAASGAPAATGDSLKVESRRDGRQLSTARLGDIVELVVAAHGQPYEVCVDRFGGESCRRSTRARIAWQVASGDGVRGRERLTLRVAGHEVTHTDLLLVRPTTLFRYGGFPVWSPDGRRVAFDTWDGNVNIEIGDVEVAVADATGAPRPHQVTLNLGVSVDRWSHGGIVVHGGGGADTSAVGLRTLNEDQTPADRLFAFNGMTVRRLWTLTPKLGLEDAVWSPDGKRIAFDSERSGDNDVEVYVVNADGSGVRRLTKLHGAGDPAWSPDGRELAFDAHESVYLMRADGTHLRRLARGRLPRWAPGRSVLFEHAGAILTASGRRLAAGASPIWSADGRKIAYVERGRLLTMNADGTAKEQVTGRLGVSHPAWSPDGKRIAFDAGTGCEVEVSGTCQVWVVNADGTNLHRLTPISQRK